MLQTVLLLASVRRGAEGVPTATDTDGCVDAAARPSAAVPGLAGGSGRSLGSPSIVQRQAMPEVHVPCPELLQQRGRQQSSSLQAREGYACEP